MMKTKMLMALLLMTSWNIHANERITNNLPISDIFIPQEGYDNNDKVEFVIDGVLPSICFEMQTVNVTRQENRFQVSAKMKRKDLNECKNTGTPPQALAGQFPVLVHQVVSLGELQEGTYSLSYQTSTGDKTVTFRVGASNGQTIDEYLYAPVSDAFIPEMIYETISAQVILTGILPNACTQLNENDIELKRMGNVFVILPKLRLQSAQECEYNPRPLRQFVNLGPVTQGRYLIHVRSMTGVSVNKIFSVKARTLNPRGR